MVLEALSWTCNGIKHVKRTSHSPCPARVNTPSNLPLPAVSPTQLPHEEVKTVYGEYFIVTGEKRQTTLIAGLTILHSTAVSPSLPWRHPLWG